MVGLHFESIRIGKGSLENSLFCLSEQHGEPFADAANVPLFEMCQALNSKIKVVLQGMVVMNFLGAIIDIGL